MAAPSSTPPRWGSQPVDPGEPNLPALKVRYLLDHLPPNGNVLEIGSGDGKILRTFSLQRPELRLHGCDVRAWAADVDIDFRLITSRDVPYEDASMDAVVIVDTLEHVDDPEYLVAEIARLLRPNGRFLAFVPVEGEPVSAYALYRRLLGKDLYVRTKEHVQSYTFADIDRLLARDFELVHRDHIYHAFGHIMDATFFAAAALPRLHKFWWSENRYYTAEDEKPSSPLATVLNGMLAVGNAIAYLESRMLAKYRHGAAGMLFEARRRSNG